MDLLLILARVLHVGLGAFWAGVVLYNAVFLGPAMRDAGPDGMKVGAALMRRRLMVVMPWIAGLTILSGLWLYWRMSGGFAPGYMSSRMGATLGVGGLAAITAFAIGMVFMRPAMMRAMALSQQAAQRPPGPERDAALATADALRRRGALGERVVTGLIAVALLAMALARYV
jgi:hypothetical protein